MEKHKHEFAEEVHKDDGHEDMETLLVKIEEDGKVAIVEIEEKFENCKYSSPSCKRIEWGEYEGNLWSFIACDYSGIDSSLEGV